MNFINYTLKNNFITIKFNDNYKEIINSLIKTKILKGVTITDNYHTIMFNCTSIEKFDVKQFSELEIKMKCIYDLCNQINYLICLEKKSLFAFSLNNLFVINKSTFIYLPNNDDIYDIDKDFINIILPFSRDKYFKSPELTEIKELPCSIHFKTIYYSLGCFFIYLLTNGNKCINEIEKYPFNCIKDSYFSESKIDFFLDRCIKHDAYERYMIYI
jgi:hypothetical protein